MPKWNKQQKYIRARIVSIHFYMLVILLLLNESLFLFFSDVQWGTTKSIEILVITLVVVLSVNITLMYKKVFEKKRKYPLANTLVAACLTLFTGIIIFTQNSPFIQQGLVQSNVIIFILLLQFTAQTVFSAISYRESITIHQKRIEQ